MDTHAQPELLSALVDGELDERDRAEVEDHLRGCEPCRTTVAALRATLDDMAGLGAPEWTEQDSWRLHAALRRARSPKRRRIGGAVAGIAAAMVTILAITVGGNSGGGGQLFSLDSPVPVEGPAGPEAMAGKDAAGMLAAPDYDSASADALLAGFADREPAQRSMDDAARDTSVEEGIAAALPDDARGCADSFGDDELTGLVHFESASYEGTAAWLYIYATRGGSHRLFVRAHEGCADLYYAER